MVWFPKDSLLWAIIATVVVIDAIWSWWLGIGIAIEWWMVLLICVPATIHAVYIWIKPDQRIAAIAGGLAQLTIFILAGTSLSYLVTAASRFQMLDRQLANADAALGFDWLALFGLIRSHQVTHLLFGAAYITPFFQIFFLLMFLPAIRRPERARELLLLIVSTSITVTALSWFTPAEGAWAHYGVAHLTTNYYLPDFRAVRAGEMREIVLSQSTGIIQFPSFHAAMAVILIYASRGIRVLFPALIGLNLLVMASIPAYGGHHLMDVVAGIVVASVVIFILRAVQYRVS
jgi:hypothetical protein